MTTLHKLIHAAAALLLASSLPAGAASSASSASSEAGSASIGSVSTSFEKSSESSTGDRRAAAGDYRLLELAQAPNRHGMARMKLQSLADEQAEFFLYLPQPAAEQSRLAAGAVITVKERPYGLEFARQATQEAFFLVVADDWLRELQTRVVAL
ncbi:MAG TPA: hypothetical protein VK570_07450 [Rubrivivax sp.]|nr:hypothetical protein [Rubrivivax sp.]